MNVYEEFDKLSKEIRQCTKCKLSSNKINYVVGSVGKTHPSLVIIGESPGFREDVLGEPFMGISGSILEYTLETCLNLKKEDCTLLLAVHCKPPKGLAPMPSELKACRHWLHKQLKIVDAKLVITLGKWSVLTLLHHPKFRTETLAKMRFRYYEDLHNPKFRILPTYNIKTTENDKHKKELFLRDFKSFGDGSYKEKRKLVRYPILPHEQKDSNIGGVVLS
jgi:DNA polymerase